MQFKVGSFGRLFRGNGVTAINVEPWGIAIKTDISREAGAAIDQALKNSDAYLDKRLAELDEELRSLGRTPKPRTERAQEISSFHGGSKLDYTFDELNYDVALEHGTIWSTVRVKTKDDVTLKIEGLTGENAAQFQYQFLKSHKRFTNSRLINENQRVIRETESRLRGLLKLERKIEPHEASAVSPSAPSGFWSLDYEPTTLATDVKSWYSAVRDLVSSFNRHVSEHNMRIELREAAYEVQASATAIYAAHEACKQFLATDEFVSAELVTKFRATWQLPILAKEFARGLVDTDVLDSYDALQQHFASLDSAVSDHNDAWRLRQNLREIEAAARALHAFMKELGGLQTARRYLRRSDVDAFVCRLRAALDFWDCDLSADASGEAVTDFYRLREFLRTDRSQWREQRNNVFVASEIAENEAFFYGVVPRITEEQMKAAIVDENALRIIAGAGTGKTTTLFAKTAYLVELQNVAPEAVLAITYSKKSQRDLQERFNERETCSRADISTIHALGYRIVGDVRTKRPSLASWVESDNEFSRQAEHYVEMVFRDPRLREHLLYFTLLYEKEAPAPYSFDNVPQYHDWVLRAERLTLKGEILKSVQEVQIANFLRMNGVDYQYEAPYKIDTRTSRHAWYRPDFYLPQYDLYIEHYGISRDGKTAPGIDAEDYLAKMQWKRRTHRQHQTNCLETFSYEAAEGKLIETLAASLVEHGVEFQPVDEETLLRELRKVKGVSRLAAFLKRILPLWKERDDRSLTLADVYQGDAFLVRHGVPILDRLFELYENDLRAGDYVDYSDMILEAQRMLEEGSATCKYDVVMLDEAQDLSPARARLISTYVKSGRDVRFTAVGDDWQSIYRFAGSQPSTFLDFDERFGPDCVTLNLTATHRFNESVERPTSTFVARNPRQTQRVLQSVAAPEPALHAVAYGFDEAAADVLAVDQLAVTYDLTGKHILFVYRTKFDEPNNLAAVRAKYRSAKFTSVTAHSSKGLEADFVVVLAANARWNGFPSTRPPEPAIEPLLPGADAFPFAEDRRLFYVATTRGKVATLICYCVDLPSPFVDELISYAPLATMTHIPDSNAAAGRVKCRSCGIGYYVVREKDGRTFLGCSHYPACVETSAVCPTCNGIPYITQDRRFVCVDCGETAGPLCPECNRGWLVRKRGRNGDFFGCSRWRVDRMGCQYTEDASQPAIEEGECVLP